MKIRARLHVYIFLLLLSLFCERFPPRQRKWVFVLQQRKQRCQFLFPFAPFFPLLPHSSFPVVFFSTLFRPSPHPRISPLRRSVLSLLFFYLKSCLKAILRNENLFPLVFRQCDYLKFFFCVALKLRKKREREEGWGGESCVQAERKKIGLFFNGNE